MRISSIPPQELYQKYVQRKSQGERPVKSAQADRLEVSENALTFSATLKAAKLALGEGSDFNAAKVETIKMQLEASQYSVSGMKVAEKMFGE